jgi:uncharacterized membrane protein (DUF441 family)
MTERIRKGFKITKQATETVWDIFVQLLSLAGITKLASQPHVNSAIGKLPLWQAVAGVLLMGVVVHEYKLRIRQ